MKYIVILLLTACSLLSCQDRLTDDPSARLYFSCDTLRFDTVFTVAGSVTKTVMLRNPGKRAVEITRARMEHGECFLVNLDGEQDLSRIDHIRVAGGDSLFLFVRAQIDPADRNQPLLVEDKMLLEVGNHTETLCMEAYGWDVHLIDSLEIRTPMHFTAERPYLVRNWILVSEGASLTLDAGARIYMHDGAQMAIYGSLLSYGSLDAPVRILPDRIDNLFDSIPYLYVSGKWDGIYAVNPDSINLQHTEIWSGRTGLYVESPAKPDKSDRLIRIEHCQIHNQSLYGVILQNVHALIGNSEISNTANYSLYLDGGQYEIIHSTIASYFGATGYVIQGQHRADTITPMYINNLSKTTPTHVRMVNSVVAGAQPNNLLIATPLPQYYDGELAWNYLQTDSLYSKSVHDNVYGAATDTLFVCSRYSKKSQYYDFRPDSTSRLLGIGDSLAALPYPVDRLGVRRDTCSHPTAGCYQLKTENL